MHFDIYVNARADPSARRLIPAAEKWTMRGIKPSVRSALMNSNADIAAQCQRCLMFVLGGRRAGRSAERVTNSGKRDTT